MKTYFPNYFKKIGITLFIISFFVSILSTMHTHVDESEYEKYSISQEGENIENLIADPFTIKTRNNIKRIGIILSITALLVYVFSSEKIEDEFIQNLRYKSLMQSLIITWLSIGILSIIKDFYAFDTGIIKFTYNGDPINILNTQLILYIIIFHRKKKKY